MNIRIDIHDEHERRWLARAVRLRIIKVGGSSFHDIRSRGRKALVMATLYDTLVKVNALEAPEEVSLTNGEAAQAKLALIGAALPGIHFSGVDVLANLLSKVENAEDVVYPDREVLIRAMR